MADSINWNDIIDAARAQNSTGIQMRGQKRYTPVSIRMEIARRFLGSDIGVSTEIVTWGHEKGSPVVVRATIARADGSVLATGHAEEIRGAGNVNQTSALENAETSAIGRALAALGLSGGEFASANELDGVERKKAAQRPEEPAHDPETGEIPQPHATIGGSVSAGIRDAWLDGVRDSLPANYTPKQFQEAVADALVSAFFKLKTARGVSQQWDKRADLIEDMQVAHPAAYHRVQDAFDKRMSELREGGQPLPHIAEATPLDYFQQG